MNNQINPWHDIQPGSIRRVDAETKHNIFWFKDTSGNYGLRISLSRQFKKELDERLEGITLAKRNINDQGEFFIVLTNGADWEIFLVLLSNLISLAERYTVEEAMVKAIENRIKRWKTLLKQGKLKGLSREKQMGLITELIWLKDFLTPEIGIEGAIIAWVGCYKDKQDFITQRALFEVKSYQITKAKKINISSASQLSGQKEPLYLVCFGLSINEDGLSIPDIVEEIHSLLIDEPIELGLMFDDKLFEYGYTTHVNDTMGIIHVNVESCDLYEVRDDFPRITSSSLDSRISRVNYSIDIDDCADYIISTKNIFNHAN